MRIAKTIQTSTIILLLALAVAGAAHAATTLEVGLPGVEGAAAGDTVSSVPTYIKYLYYFVLGLVGIAGFSSLVFWGAVWAGSGIVDKKAQAIAGIKNTLTGIGIALTAFILLNTINPDLIVIKTPDVSEIKPPSRPTLGTLLTDGTPIEPGNLCSLNIPGACPEGYICIPYAKAIGNNTTGICQKSATYSAANASPQEQLIYNCIQYTSQTSCPSSQCRWKPTSTGYVNGKLITSGGYCEPQ